MNIHPARQPLEAEGEPPTVIALHAGDGAPEQWRPLVERLRFRYRVLAPNLHGYNVIRASSTGEPFSLDAEAALIDPLLDAFPGLVYLVGHGYGATVALKLALARRERISGLVLYEPTLFSLLFADATPASAYAAIDVPVLLLSGARPRTGTPRIAQLLARTLPRAEWRQLDGVGYMGPGSHPEEVDREIEDFLARHSLVSYRDLEPTAAFASMVSARRGGPDRADAASREESRALPSTPSRVPWNCARHRARG